MYGFLLVSKVPFKVRVKVDESSLFHPRQCILDSSASVAEKSSTYLLLSISVALFQFTMHGGPVKV